MNTLKQLKFRALNLMKKSQLAFLSVILANMQMVSAQTVIKGRIADTNGESLPYSSVCILQVADSAMVACCTADSLGNFVLEKVPFKEQYLLFCSFVGYDKTYQTVALSDAITDLGDISLNENNYIKEVVVSGTRALIERKQGMMVYHVERAASTGGSSAWEALEKSPGVFTGSGGISLNGKQGVVIYINGKEFYSDGAALENMLKSMSAENISKIELISNPDARYDASAEAVINIVLKQSTRQGVFGSVTGAYGIGLHSRYKTGVNLNYMNQKWNMFFAVDADKTNLERKNFSHVDFEDDITVKTLEQNSVTKSHKGALTYRADINYSLTPRHTIGLIADGNLSNRDVDIFNSATNTFDGTAQSQDNKQFADNDIRLNMLNANYKWTPENGDMQLTADLNYVHYVDPENINTYTSGTETRSEAQQMADVWVVKTDFVKNFQNGLNVNSGVKYSSSELSNFVQYRENIADNNHLDQTENIWGLYAQADYSTGKWSFSAGIRTENTDMTARDSEAIVSEDKYWKWFPSASAEWTPSEANTFGLSLSSAIERPDFENLNPSRWWVNEYTYVEGNPLLKPEFSNTLEFNWVWKQQVVTGAYYSKTKGAIMQLPEQDYDSKRIRYTNYNIDHKYEYAAYVTSAFGLSNWWMMNITPEFKYVKDRSAFMNHNIRNDYSMFTFQMVNEFVISSHWGLTGELSGFYVTPQYQGVYRIERVYQVSAGLKKKLFNNKASLALNITDIFNSRSPKAGVDFYNQQSSYVFREDTRYFRVSLSYNFGKSVSGKAKNDSADDLVNRLGR